MKKTMLSLVAVLAVSATALADPDLLPVPLHLAVAEGTVSVSVQGTAGYGRVLMAVKNRTSAAVTVKIPGSYLKPRGGRYQRLALGYPEAERRPTISLAANAGWSGWVTSCCMDHGLSGPDRSTSYDICLQAVPDKVREIMEKWAEHPQISQSKINGEVWGNSPPAPPPEPDPKYHPADLKVLAWGDRILVLFKSGELLRSRDDGKWESLGSGVLAAGVGSGRVFARFGSDRVKEYCETEKQWAQRGGLLAGAEGFLASPDAVYARAGDVLYRLGPSGWVVARRGVAGASLSLGAGTSWLFIVGTDRRIARSDGPAGAWKVSDRRGFAQAVVSAGTLFGVDPRGLVKITEKGYERVYTPAGCRGYLPWRGGFYAIENDGDPLEYVEPSGGWTRPPALPGAADIAAVDPVTGTLIALQGGRILRLARGGQWELALALPRADDPAGGTGALLEQQK
jgi:hypothetical protein